MSNIDGKIKKWISQIQEEQLNDVTNDIQANVFVRNEKVNRYIFKLLLYLSHTADKCNKQNYVTGNEIYKLTCLLCSILIEIPDNVKFVSSLFHIIRCLLTMRMYNEAHRVCFYLNTEAIRYSDNSVSDILEKIAYLWYNAINKELIILQKDPLDPKNYHRLKNVMTYEFEMIKIAFRNFTKQLLMKMCSYLDKIALINKEPNYFVDFSAFIIEHVGQTEMFLHKDETHIICRHMLHITSRIICETINENSIKSSANVLNSIGKYFKKVLLENEECYQYFVLFECLCFTLVKSVECLIETTIKSIQDLNETYVMLAKKYGFTGSIKWTTLSIVQVLESLFTYWEKHLHAGRKVHLNSDVLLEILNLVGYISKCFIKQVSDRCKSCQSEHCKVRRDTYNAVVIKTRCINLISKFSIDDLSKDNFVLARRFLEQNVALIYEMKECKCKCWTQLWSTSSALIYNLGVMSDKFYEESVSLFSLLLTSVVQFEGIQSRSQYINLQNPISVTLHRISSLHYNQGMYREAMTATALNALLSYNDFESKAFRMWANIKHKCVSSKEIMELTILACLRRDRAKMEELGMFIDLSKYDCIEICLREAKGLQEAKVNLSKAIHKVLSEMKALKATQVEQARVVQMLLYHLINFDNDEDTLKYLKEAMSNLKQAASSSSVACLQANLEFHVFVSQLRATNKKTQIEMENTKFALYAPKLNEIGESESSEVVPAYSMINIKEDSRLMTYLKAPLKKWNKYLKQNINEIVQKYEPMITLHTLIIAGEYAHLYRYEECEVNIWNLVHALASELQDNSAIIYATARSIALRHINYERINIAKELANQQKDINDESMIYAIAIFWISLSDFYFECDMHDEARKLLDKSRELPGISFFKNIAVYLYSLDKILHNCHLYKQTIKHEEYTKYIVETLYTMVNLNEELSARKWMPQDRRLFGFDILLSATVNLSLRMNSLLSFREIGTHLVRRLKTAQTLGASIRVAEILKSLCYIDLSRTELNDCEVKLQGLEHILNIEMFKASMNSSPTKMCPEVVLITPTKAIDPIRDVPQNDASPILRNKVFDLPEFMYHKDCTCYMCQNVSYHYLIFTSTNIRAQLYALQKNITASLQHFHGAFKIKESLLRTDKYITKHGNKYFSWQERFYIVDYVQLLINFSYFVKNYLNTTEEKIISIILLAVQICDMYKLKGHPIYLTVTELMLDYHFQKLYNASDYSKFTVPDTSDIDVDKYIQEPKVEETICVTPTISDTRTKKPIALRRHRTPPLLKLTKVNMNFSDDEDSISSPPIEYKKRSSTRAKLTRRKIFDEVHTDNHIKDETKISKNILMLDDLIEIREENLKNFSMRDIVKKIASLAPDISEVLSRSLNTLDEPATIKNIRKLIDTIRGFKTNESSQKNIRKTRHSKHVSLNDCNKINEVIALFKNIGIDEEKDINGSSSQNEIKSERKKESTSSLKKGSSLRQKKNRISNESDMDKSEENIFSIDQYDNIDNIKETCTSENTRLRITRNSKEYNATKESRNIKTRKSKEKIMQS